MISEKYGCRYCAYNYTLLSNYDATSDFSYFYLVTSLVLIHTLIVATIAKEQLSVINSSRKLYNLLDSNCRLVFPFQSTGNVEQTQSSSIFAIFYLHNYYVQFTSPTESKFLCLLTTLHLLGKTMSWMQVLSLGALLPTSVAMTRSTWGSCSSSRYYEQLTMSHDVYPTATRILLMLP